MTDFRRLLLARSDPYAWFVSHRLRAEFGHAPLGEAIAGVVFAPAAGPHGSSLAWFRAERRRDVRWGGDPAQPVDVDSAGTVSPRKSFAAYLETVEGQALPWRPEEIASARRMEALLDIDSQRRLKSRTELLQVALAQLDERVVITEAFPIDVPGPRIVMATRAVEQATGYTADELIGATPRIFQGPGTDRGTLDRLRQALEHGLRVQVDVLNYTKDGRPVWVDLDVAPVRAESGRVTHWIAIQRDITERKNAERDIARQRDELKAVADELRLAKQAADRANEAKSQFLANMSHELRTPMHAILSFSKLGLERVDETTADKLKRYFSNIRDSGERLTRLLNDLLDLSKLEAGRMQMTLQQVEVPVVIDECLIEFEPLLAAKSLRFEFRRPSEPLAASIDPIRIGQVVRNLLSNAIKFSPVGGRIELTLDIGGAAPLPGSIPVPPGCFRMSVVDEGIGIPDAELEEVFDKFVQSSKTQAGYEGTGLGLAICREIVTAHGGTIRALPTGGRGSRFEVLLTLAR
jgi:PAS domain S-box-containing protein